METRKQERAPYRIHFSDLGPRGLKRYTERCENAYEDAGQDVKRDGLSFGKGLGNAMILSFYHSAVPVISSAVLVPSIISQLESLIMK